MTYGLEQCPICGKIYEKPAPRSSTCGNPECKRLYKNKWEREHRHKLADKPIQSRGRYSGETYTNTPDKIAAIMAKYQNGVKKEQIENWINGL